MQIAVLGLGAMGTRMAANLLKAGYAVTVYNRTPERALALEQQGAVYAASPRAAAERADLVLSMVRDDEASRAVWLDPASGAIHSLRPDAIAVESSTLTPAWVQQLATRIEGVGAAFLEAPVLGSRPQAEAAQLIALVGGSAAELARSRAVLAAMAGTIHHVGPIGAGALMKLVVNTQLSVQTALLAELLGLLERQGIDAEQAVGLLNGLPTTSPAMQAAGRLMAARSFAPLFPIALVEKDLGYALAAARGAGASTPLLAVAHDLYAAAVERGFGGDHIVGIRQLFEQPPVDGGARLV
jgi:3-hydroxyisobutyrate dehydrogenase